MVKHASVSIISSPAGGVTCWQFPPTLQGLRKATPHRGQTAPDPKRQNGVRQSKGEWFVSSLSL